MSNEPSKPTIKPIAPYPATKPIVTPLSLFWHTLRNLSIGCVMLSILIILGVVGYRYIVHLSWIDSFLNASMVVTGIGEINPLINDASKIFASYYALVSSVAFVGIIAVMLAPVVHKFFRKIHLEQK